MTEVERMLRAASAEIDWPSTPDLTTAVSARIAAGASGAAAAPRPRRRLPIGRPLAIALAALLLMAAAAAAIPAVRDPVFDWLGLRSVRVERVPSPLPAGRGDRLGLGARSTLDGARRSLDFTPLEPHGLGVPAVYYDSFPPGGQLGLVYPGRVVVTELQGTLQRRYLAKFLPPGTKADPVRIGADRALWIHGAPHQYAYLDRNGAIRTDSVRTAGDVLLWRHGDLLIRIEGARSRAEALRIARSARAAP